MRKVLALFLALGCCFFAACEKKTDSTESRRVQLLQDENARLVQAVAERNPDAGARPTIADPSLPAAENTRRLSEANEKLRAIYREGERADEQAFSVAKRGEIERAVERIRGLRFKRPVDYSVLGRKDIKAALTKRLNAVFSDEEFEEQANAMARLGLVPEKFALKETLVTVLGEQVAAFYDQHEHRLYMYDDATLENTMNQMILAHELMHAMQDQQFSLKSLPLEEKRNDDRAIAAASLVEGEATLLMMEFMTENPSPRMMLDNLSAMFVQNMAELVKAPRILRESLVFPYQDGMTFCMVGYQRRGWPALTQAYAKPPSSTAQILHPEKYFNEPREEPVPIEWPDVKFENRRPQWDNVMGELGIRILMVDWHNAEIASKAAEGWRGDRYLSFESGDAFVWKTKWATPKDAEEFFKAEEGLLQRRYKPENSTRAERRWSADRPRALRLVMNDHGEVLVIDAATPEKAAALEKQFNR